jgi:Flp pilus assembly protein TadD
MVPGDDEAMRKSKDLAANATISRSGLDSADHRIHQEAQAPDVPVEADLDELKRSVMSPEENLRKQIEDEPTRVGPYLELADMLRRFNKLDEAEKVLAAGLKACPREPLLQEAHGDVQIARLQRAQASWTKRTRDHPNDAEARAKLEQIEKALADYELKELRRRSEHRPDDLQLRFQLGLRLARLGKPDLAIAEFQQARQASDSELKVQALHQLGLCFEAKDLPKLAVRNYQEALKLADPADQALFNALHYRLGRAAEAGGDLKSAEEHYNEVAANDYGYEDVARRLENLNRRPDL